jgi:DNA topoisomerase-1
MYEKTITNLYKNAERTANVAGLAYSTNISGYLRKKHGRGFIYTNMNGKDIDDSAIIERINKLKIPPIWTDVVIAKNPKAHLQVVGTDAKGRKQYIYHPKWREFRDMLNFYRMIPFGQKLGQLRKKIEEYLSEEDFTQQKVIAAVLKLIDTLHIRIGNEQYSKENHTYGLTTLRDRHVDITQNSVVFTFVGKANKEHSLEIKDEVVAQIVQEAKDVPGNQLFQYYDAAGNPKGITSQDINNFLKEVTGEDFTAKDFRTWTGTSEMFRRLRNTQCKTKSDYTKNLSKSLEKVAISLGNTKAVCRKHYIHPEIIRCYKDHEFFDKLLSLKKQMRREELLKSHEIELILFLKDSLKRDIILLKNN